MTGRAESLRLVLRLLALLLVVPATYYFIFWLPPSPVPFGEGSVLPSLIALACAAAAGWSVWNRLGKVNPGLVTSVMLGAMVLGAIGFCGGFFGPMIFAPEANQGPLLGLFITGPLGFLLGGIGGLVYWQAKKRKGAA
jgi:hypothetical protein